MRADCLFRTHPVSSKETFPAPNKHMSPPTLSTVDPPAALNLSNSPIVQQYCEMTPKSSALAAQSRVEFPSGITHDIHYVEPHDIFVARAEGSHQWDVDGNEYVDYFGIMVPCCWTMAIRWWSRP